MSEPTPTPAASCTPIAKSLGWCQGTPVLPGIRDKVYYVHKADIVSWPTIATDSYGRPTAAKYSGNFTLATGKKFHTIDIIADKSTLTSEAQGEVPSQTQLNKATLLHPTVGEAATEAASYINNSDIVFIVCDKNGKYRVLGNENYNTKVTIAQDLGQGATGNASTTINIEVTDMMPAPFYEGEIETENGTINEQPEYDEG